MTELLACPFCGSVNLKVYLNAPASDMRPWEHVACLDCGTGQTTVEKWNTRTPIVIDDAMVERGAVAAMEQSIRDLGHDPATIDWRREITPAQLDDFRENVRATLEAALNPQEKTE